MSGTGAPNDIVLYWYPQSPYGRRVTWYLALRNIAYAECIQPPILPRPDVDALGINYRRSPIMAIGRDIYVDTRLMIARLEELFPPSSQHPALSTKETVGMAGLLQKLATEGSMFREVAKNIPSHFPLLRDEKFQKDRAKLFPPSPTKTEGRLVRPEAIASMRHLFDVVEAIFADGREWVGGATSKLTLADLEGLWPLDWFITDLEPSREHFSETIYPKVYAWRNRFRSALDAAKQQTQKPLRVKGEQATSFVTSSTFSDQDLVVDAGDPLKLQEGAMVEVFPLDYGGHLHQDRGRLIKLTKDEVAIAVQSQSGDEIHVHAPRWQFRVKAIASARL